MRRLAVTGDDFGASADVNGAIVEAHRRGVLTAASLMVTGAAASQAVALAHEHPGLSVGLHLVLVDGRAAMPVEGIRNLVGPDGLFHRSPTLAGLRYYFSSESRGELLHEVRRQLELFRETGLLLSHVDGHHHLHLHPVVLDILAALSKEFGVRAIRIPREELRTAFLLGRNHLLRNAVWSAVFAGLRVRSMSRLREANVAVADRVYGLCATGDIDEDYLLRLIPKMQGQDVELYCHPSCSRRGSGREELAALLSTRVRDALSANGFALRGGLRDFPSHTEVASRESR